MVTLQTNRDLYLAIGRLRSEYKGLTRSLEEYLRALLGISQGYAQEERLSVEALWSMLSGALGGEAAPFEEAWRERYDQRAEEGDDYRGWRATLIRQIVDLREMEEAGLLAKEDRYFGMSAPRGAHWYNFDIFAYLECAMAGSFGGWQQGDSTGRVLVPGPVSVMEESGEIATVDPQDIEQPIVALSSITWEDFEDFLMCGQIYE
ncbi:hypothetical protein L6R29_12865 [Myxococcota bacterium]|nr:hypothetical protein [Myxococcota bacterium]